MAGESLVEELLPRRYWHQETQSSCWWAFDYEEVNMGAAVVVMLLKSQYHNVMSRYHVRVRTL